MRTIDLPTHLFPLGEDHKPEPECWCKPVLVELGPGEDVMVHRPQTVLIYQDERAVQVRNLRIATIQ